MREQSFAAPYDVRKLVVAGPHVFICDECVELSMTLVRDEGGSFYLRRPAEYCKLAEGNVRVAEAAGVPRFSA
ncbi:ClpX C4-type zinc finger protein [Bradyrhizobium erythrophlei]|uniref:ClpX C4-type zinc finger protein n=1 Tax=Bradyrhizobium erythrophlei TaxID=1437360 RepID=UPI0035EE713C